MKQTLAVPLILLLLRTVPAVAQFEGSIDMKMTRRVEGESHSVLYSMSVSGEKLAAQATEGAGDAQKGKFIFRGDRKVMWVIDDKGKTYLEISLAGDSNNKKKEGAGRRRVESKVNLRKTGGTEKILGYACEEWVAQDTGEETHVWGTSKLGNVYEGLMSSFGKMNPGQDESQMNGWEGELARMKVFPLKIVTTEDGDTTEAQEVTRIDPKPVGASVFEPPAGYKKQTLDADMGKMMDQLQSKSRHGRGGDSSMNKEDLEKLMKEMQEKYEQGQKDKDDSSKEHEEPVLPE